MPVCSCSRWPGRGPSCLYDMAHVAAAVGDGGGHGGYPAVLARDLRHQVGLDEEVAGCLAGGQEGLEERSRSACIGCWPGPNPVRRSRRSDMTCWMGGGCFWVAWCSRAWSSCCSSLRWCSWVPGRCPARGPTAAAGAGVAWSLQTRARAITRVLVFQVHVRQGREGWEQRGAVQQQLSVAAKLAALEGAAGWGWSCPAAWLPSAAPCWRCYWGRGGLRTTLLRGVYLVPLSWWVAWVWVTA
jgi:hypothetical protein